MRYVKLPVFFVISCVVGSLTLDQVVIPILDFVYSHTGAFKYNHLVYTPVLLLLGGWLLFISLSRLYKATSVLQVVAISALAGVGVAVGLAGVWGIVWLVLPFL